MERNEFITRLQDLYEKAENLFNDDKGNEAAELLKQEIPAIETVAETPGAIIPWLDATSLLANILLLLSRPDEALEYGKKVYEAAKLYLPGTLELIYATELYASCFKTIGREGEAVDLYKRALDCLEYEISEIQALRDGIIKDLKEIAEE